MSADDVHFEIFVRRYPDSGWALKAATDVRTTASQYIAAGIVMQSIPVVLAAAPGVIEPVTFAPYRFA